MVGDHCAVIAMDRRLGAQFQTVATNFQRIFKVNDKILLGLAGLGTDIQTFSAALQYSVNLYKLREGRDIQPRAFMQLLVTSQYSRRFGPYFVEPVVVGLNEANEPYIATADSIGTLTDTDSFFCIGAGSAYLLGACESFYKPGLNAEDLFEVAAQSLLSGVDRDALSGWGAVAYILTPSGVTVRTLKGRMD